MKQELFNLIQSKAPGSIPLYLVVRGSHAYGTNLPTSDTDYAGVFVQDMDSILGMLSIFVFTIQLCRILLIQNW